MKHDLASKITIAFMWSEILGIDYEKEESEEDFDRLLNILREKNWPIPSDDIERIVRNIMSDENNL